MPVPEYGRLREEIRMSILLNLPMPKNCDECPCNDDNWRCGATGEYFDYDDMYTKRRDDCPLIEVETVDQEELITPLNMIGGYLKKVTT